MPMQRWQEPVRCCWCLQWHPSDQYWIFSEEARGKPSRWPKVMQLSLDLGHVWPQTPKLRERSWQPVVPLNQLPGAAPQQIAQQWQVASASAGALDSLTRPPVLERLGLLCSGLPWLYSPLGRCAA